MELTHRFSVPADIDATWELFNRVDLIAPCFPGATIDSVRGDEFTGSIKIKFGPAALAYGGGGKYVRRDAATKTLVFEASGRERRGNGTADALVTAQLIENGTTTIVEVGTDLNITGKPAQFGGGVITDVSERLSDQFVDNLTNRLAEGMDLSQPVPGVTLGAAGSGNDSDFAAQPGYVYTPPSDAGQSDLNIIKAVAPVLIKRYLPPLAGGLVLLMIIRAIVKAARKPAKPSKAD